MPDFRYTLDYERHYHDLGLVQPGDVRTLRKAPDEHWKPVQHKDKRVDPDKLAHKVMSHAEVKASVEAGRQNEPPAPAGDDTPSEE